MERGLLMRAAYWPDAPIHEAAHAVAARALGVEVVRVEANAAGGGATTTRGADDWQRAVVYMAGLEAARIRAERYPNDVTDFAAELDGAESDLRGFREALPGDSETSRGLRARAQDKSRAILLERWEDVERLADAIAVHRRLDADEVDELLGPPKVPSGGGQSSPAARAATISADDDSWFVATRDFESAGHRVIAGVSRCRPDSPAHRADPDAWRPATAADGAGRPRYETRGSGEPCRVR